MASCRYSSADHRSPSSSELKNPNFSRALTKATTTKEKNTHNFGSMMKKFMGKRSNLRPGSAERVELPTPEVAIKKAAAAAAAAPVKPSNFSAFHRKLFPKGGSADLAAGKALTEVNSNTRTLAMVLRSERELLTQNKEYEADISELKFLIAEKNRQVEKLKDLCLKQREEIKALKDAILFPDAMDSQLHVLLEKQGSELKQAKHVIPSLQKQVTCLTGQLQSLADDLAEVKADKYTVKTCFDGHVSSPETPKYGQEGTNSLEYSSGGPITSLYGSPDDMFLKDLNPCLTPCSSKIKSKEYDEMSGYDSLDKDISFQNSTDVSAETFSGSIRGKMSKSSENCKPSGIGYNTTRKIYKSDDRKQPTGMIYKLDERNHPAGKPKDQNLF